LAKKADGWEWDWVYKDGRWLNGWLARVAKMLAELIKLGK